jgi:hypothetical protein
MPLSEIINTLRAQTGAQYVGGSSGQPLLTSGQTYDSGWISNPGSARIVGTVVATTIGGTLTIDQSNDATNADAPGAPITVVAGTPQSFSIEAVGTSYRLHYVNGAGTQTAFRLYSNLRHV